MGYEHNGPFCPTRHKRGSTLDQKAISTACGVFSRNAG